MNGAGGYRREGARLKHRDLVTKSHDEFALQYVDRLVQPLVEVWRRTGKAGLEDDLGDEERPAGVVAGRLDQYLGCAHCVLLASARAVNHATHACATDA